MSAERAVGGAATTDDDKPGRGAPRSSRGKQTDGEKFVTAPGKPWYHHNSDAMQTGNAVLFHATSTNATNGTTGTLGNQRHAGYAGSRASMANAGRSSRGGYEDAQLVAATHQCRWKAQALFWHSLLQYLVRRHRRHLANWRVNSSHFPHWK